MSLTSNARAYGEWLWKQSKSATRDRRACEGMCFCTGRCREPEPTQALRDLLAEYRRFFGRVRPRYRVKARSERV